MSLETQLKANTEAINRLADLLERANIALPAPVEAGNGIPQEERAEPTAEAPTAEPTASAPVEAEQAASNDDDADAEAATPATTEEVAEKAADEPAAKAPTAEAPTTEAPTKATDINDVINAMKSVLAAKGKAPVIAILKKYSVARVSDLDSRDLDAALADFEGA